MSGARRVTGQLVRAVGRTAVRGNTVFASDGAVERVVGGVAIDRCPGCGTEGAQCAVLVDNRLFHSMGGECAAVFERQKTVAYPARAVHCAGCAAVDPEACVAPECEDIECFNPRHARPPSSGDR